MQQELYQSIISTENSTFVEIVESNLMQGKPLVALLRYSHHGGAREYFLLRSHDDFQFVLRKSRPKDALTFFFELSFPVSGFVTSELKDKALSYLDAILENGEEAVFVIRLDARDVSMGINDMKGFSKVGQLDKWLSDNLGIPVIIGLLAFWEDNSDEKITAYVPDIDGQVRRGAY